jgi:hypothetical protein
MTQPIVASRASPAAGIGMMLLARPALAGSDDTLPPPAVITPVRIIPLNPVGVDKSDPDYVSTGPAIPADFDPRTATDEELEKLDLPPRPRDPRLLDAWIEALSRPQAPLPKNAVIIEDLGVVHGLAQPAELPADNTDTIPAATRPDSSAALAVTNPNHVYSPPGPPAGFDPLSATPEENENIICRHVQRTLQCWTIGPKP